MEFTHTDGEGRARMVDVSGKSPVRRRALARGEIMLRPETVALIRENGIRKGDVLTVAKIAGINAAKRTSDIIPLCHPLGMDHVDVDFTIGEDRITIEASAACTGKTGVEMEALSAVAGAALGIYDMCKAVDREMRITGITLVEKRKEPLE